MTARRGATDLAGIVPVDKPAGMTSHDVVDALRCATGEGRVGHAGTLDPMATGLLVALVGPFTRLEPYLSGAVKCYDARIAFGTSTDTDDTDGEVIDVAPVPDGVFESHHAQAVLDSLLGEAMQTPPAYSAIKSGGRVAHRAARSGSPLELAPRPVRIDSAELLRIDADARTWDVAFRVSKGTYVRALARDIGETCGTLATLSALRRTSAGMLSLDDALPLDEVVSAVEEGRFTDVCVDPMAALALPVLRVSPGDVANGRALDADTAPHLPQGAIVSVTCEDVLYGVYVRAGDRILPQAIVSGRPA